MHIAARAIVNLMYGTYIYYCRDCHAVMKKCSAYTEAETYLFYTLVCLTFVAKFVFPSHRTGFTGSGFFIANFLIETVSATVVSASPSKRTIRASYN